MLEITGPIFERYAKRCGSDFVALTNTRQPWWGLEKFRVRSFAKGYERILYLDADAMIRDDAPNLFDVVPTGHVAMHDDYRHLPSYAWLYNERRLLLESQRLPMDDAPTAWNTGVVLCNASQADIWQPPAKEFPATQCAEQFWIEHAARPYPFFELPTAGCRVIFGAQKIGQLTPVSQNKRTSTVTLQDRRSREDLAQSSPSGSRSNPAWRKKIPNNVHRSARSTTMQIMANRFANTELLRLVAIP